MKLSIFSGTLQLIAAGSLMLTGNANAASAHLEFEASVGYVDSFMASHTNAIHAGDTIRWSYIVDLTDLNSDAHGHTFASLNGSNLQLSIAGNAYSAPGTGVYSVADNNGGYDAVDSIAIPTSRSSIAFDGFGLAGIYASTGNLDESAFQFTDDPHYLEQYNAFFDATKAALLGNEASSFIQFYDVNNAFPDTWFQSNINLTNFNYTVSDAPSQVPLPGAIWLFGAGLISIFGARLKRERSV